MTPKSLLRHKLAVSPLADLATGSAFRTVIREIDAIAPPERGEARRAVQRQGLLRPAGGAARAQASTTWRSCGWSSSIRSRSSTLAAAAGALPERRGGLVPGGAGEHGRLELRRPADRGGAGGARRSRPSVPSMSAGRRPRARRPGLPRTHAAEQAALVRRRAWHRTDLSRRQPHGRRPDMATEIKVPTLGESVTTATVARWLKQPATRSRPTSRWSSWRPTRSPSRSSARRRRARRDRVRRGRRGRGRRRARHWSRTAPPPPRRSRADAGAGASAAAPPRRARPAAPPASTRRRRRPARSPPRARRRRPHAPLPAAAKMMTEQQRRAPPRSAPAPARTAASPRATCWRS